MLYALRIDCGLILIKDLLFFLLLFNLCMLSHKLSFLVLVLLLIIVELGNCHVLVRWNLFLDWLDKLLAWLLRCRNRIVIGGKIKWFWGHKIVIDVLFAWRRAGYFSAGVMICIKFEFCLLLHLSNQISVSYHFLNKLLMLKLICKLDQILGLLLLSLLFNDISKVVVDIVACLCLIVSANIKEIVKFFLDILFFFSNNWSLAVCVILCWWLLKQTNGNIFYTSALNQLSEIRVHYLFIGFWEYSILDTSRIVIVMLHQKHVILLAKWLKRLVSCFL